MYSFATFNANNLFLRYKFKDTYPGDQSKKSKADAAEALGMGFLPGLPPVAKASDVVIWDDTRRKATAKALNAVDGKLPDILCLQEVESMAAIRKLNDDHFGGHYSNFMLVDSYDPRLIDVAIMSVFPIYDVRSHTDDVPKGSKERTFSRDCLEATIALPKGPPLTLFINHLKSKLVTGKTKAEREKATKRAHARRLIQAKAVASIVKERFNGELTKAMFAVVGDFNDTPTSPSVAPLTLKTPFLTDVVSEFRDADDRWTYYYRSVNRVSQIDYVLASDALLKRIRAAATSSQKRLPHIERSGLSFKRGTGKNADKILPAKLSYFEPDAAFDKDALGKNPEAKKIPFDFKRLPSVADDPLSPISDHAPVKIWLK